MTARRAIKSAVLRMFGVTERLPASAANTVLLTFDDGPAADVTPAVLDRLDRYGARAVFFIVGNRIGDLGAVVRDIVARGHVLGNHTHTHPLDRPMSLLPYYRDLRRCQAELAALTGVTPVWFRSPLGGVNLASLVVPKLLGLRPMLWSADSRDWQLRTEPEARANGIAFGATIQAGDIVLLHDFNPFLLPLLDELLPALRGRGFDLASAVSALGADSAGRQGSSPAQPGRDTRAVQNDQPVQPARNHDQH